MSSILNVFISLKSEYEEASKGLKTIEDGIKKLTGREPKFVSFNFTFIDLYTINRMFNHLFYLFVYLFV